METKKRDSLKRQKIIIIVCLVTAAVLFTLYFAVLRPLLFPQTTETYELLAGEGVNINGCSVISAEGDGELSLTDDGKIAYATGGGLTLTVNSTDAKATAGRYYMFRALESSDVAEIYVTNATGSWGFEYDASDSSYYIKGFHGTPYNQTYFTTMLAAARNPIAMKRVTTNADNLSEYGLSDADSPAKYALTAKTGEVYRVLVGDVIVTGGGYYCTTEGSRAVYIMDTSMSAFFRSAEYYVTPLLSLPVKESDYFTTEIFTLKVDEEVFVSCGYMTDAERAETASVSTYKMFVPENYVPSSTNYSNLLRKFVSFEGLQTLKFGVAGEVMGPSELAEYGLDAPKYEIYYRYSGVDNYVYVSERQENGNYYAYSLLFNLVAEVDADTLDFLGWQFIDFVDRPMFQKNINDVAQVRVQAEGVDADFVITGSSVNDLAVALDGKVLDDRMKKNFQGMYRKMLGLSIEEYAPEVATDEWLMTLTVVTDVGIEYKYDFYNYSTRRCFFTINGVGEFYCLRDRVEQIIADTRAILNGEDVDKSVLG